MKITERYSHGWIDPRAVFGGKLIKPIAYGNEHKYTTKWGSPLMKKKKADAHEYTTEAKDMPIEACKNMWIVAYGDGPVNSVIVKEQENVMWEIGNRLYWAGELEHDLEADTYTCKS